MRIKATNLTLVFLVGAVFAGIAILLVLGSQSQEKQFSQNTDSSKSEFVSQDAIEGFPADFPVYDKSEFISFAESEDGKGRSYIWESEDSTELVYEFLKSELRIKGWTVANDNSIGGSSVASFSKNSITGFLGVFKGSSGKTVVSVTIRGS